MNAPEVARRGQGLCLSGKLDNMALSEVLNFLSVNKKSGKLALTRREGQGLIVLRRGRVIYAASSSVRATLGNILVCRGLVTETTLLEALERQHFEQEEKRLGTVLVEMGKVSREDVEEVVRYQIGLVLGELCQWTGGFFKFDAMEIPEKGEVEVDAQDFVAAEGLSTDGLLLEIAAQLDEGGRGSDGTQLSPRPGCGTAPAPPRVTLDEILSDLQAPALRGEITLMLMRFAARAVGRAALLAVRGDEVSGIGYFSFDGEVISAFTERFIHVSLVEPSVFADVVQRKETFRGALEGTPGNRGFLTQLGGGAPREAVVIPMIALGSVAMIFYGDDLPHGRPLGEVRPLELVMTEAAIEMEKQALEGRIKSFERTRRHAEILSALLEEGALPLVGSPGVAAGVRGDRR
jgi:hypothetical protein